MELAHSVKPSHWEVNKIDIHSLLTMYLNSHVMYCYTRTGAPRLVVVSPVNSTTVTVSWSEVQCFNGSGAVTHYLVQYHSMFGGAVQNVTTDGIAQTISGLTPNIAVYTFRVAAVTTNGVTGPFSNPANTSVPGKIYLASIIPDMTGLEQDYIWNCEHNVTS